MFWGQTILIPSVLSPQRYYCGPKRGRQTKNASKILLFGTLLVGDHDPNRHDAAAAAASRKPAVLLAVQPIGGRDSDLNHGEPETVVVVVVRSITGGHS